ncbi:MAG: hypothetical protein KatS3mg111_0694 [Pirellulaceae bacterium]|nr:MAG: hypothetical protein KatS3mg111_0694 [Pirellulaceae bacterium]
MQVQIQNSSISDTDAGIPIGFGQNGEVIRSPIINSTEAITTVTAYSGQTVVFAGLISKSRTTTRNQIPVLGSLPLIGPAFRYDVESEQRRELLVVLTPRIIQSDEDYEMLKQIESSRMSWCLADVLNVHGDVGLSGGNGLWGPARSQLIYPDEQPTVLDDRAVPRAGEPVAPPAPSKEGEVPVPGGVDLEFLPRVAPPPPPEPDEQAASIQPTKHLCPAGQLPATGPAWEVRLLRMPRSLAVRRPQVTRRPFNLRSALIAEPARGDLAEWCGASWLSPLFDGFSKRDTGKKRDVHEVSEQLGSRRGHLGDFRLQHVENARRGRTEA